MSKYALGGLFILSTWASIVQSAPMNMPIEGVGIDRTRLVIEKGSTSESFGIENGVASPVVVTAWVVDQKGKVSDAFVTSPSLFQLGAGKTGKGTVRVVSELPKDRESVFWLVVNTATAGNPDGKNHLNVAIGQRIKVFYRPEGLKGDARYAADKLVWAYDSGTLKVKNPTGLSVSVSEIISQKSSERVTSMVMPFSEMSWKLPLGTQPQNLSFTFIDEYGGSQKVPLKLGAS